MTFADLWNSLIVAWNGSGVISTALRVLVFLSPVILAICLGTIFWSVWVRYVQIKQFLGLKYTLLQLKLPKDTWKSPLAMETILHAIHNTSDGSLYAQYWKGETRPWYSLEVYSIEGHVNFVMWTEDRRKANLVSALYSQYPEIEITEIPDYAQAFDYNGVRDKIWASEFQFSYSNKEFKDYVDLFPIKTYIDYGLDKDPKEEFKVDPLTHILEWMGSLRPNEQAWFQFIVRAHKKVKKPGTLWKQTDLWEDKGRELVHKLLMRDPKTKVSGQDTVVVSEDGKTSIVSKKPTLSGGEQDVIEAVERKLSKLPFDVCIRTLYLASRKAFDTPFGIGGCISSMKQFNSNSLNGFKPGGKMMPGSFDYPWQDYRDVRRNRYSKRVVMAYRRRSAFYPPYKVKTLVLNTEELATMFHFPGAVAATPTLDRVPSKKAEAPGNLPI